MTNFTIDITSDIICVFCYLGKRRLEKAISVWHKTACKTDTFTIRWHPYYLQPSLPDEGVDRHAAAVKKLGGEERTRVLNDKMQKMGLAEGISFQFGGRCGRTRDAHRLAKLAESKGDDVANRLHESLFKAFHEEEKNVGEEVVLIQAATRAGMNVGEAKAFLADDAFGEQVDREVKEARGKGINGVPRFIINGKAELDGAQDPGDFLLAFQEVRELESMAQK